MYASLFRYVRELVDIPSVTGDEAAVAKHIADDLEAHGFFAELDEAAPGRPNLIVRAGLDEVRLWFCTHLDTVPPFIPSSETDEAIIGRGSCDAKGILAAMVFAARELRASGRRNFGLVRMASGHKGTLRVKIRARGKAAHSAYPEAGDSAVHRLLDVVARLRAMDWGEDEMLGPATLNVGEIAGGIAGNILAPAAEATLYWRLVGPARPARERVERMIAADRKLSLELVGQNDAVFCQTLPGFRVAPMSYSTDIPFMPSWGRPLLIGPGSIHNAHTADEYILKSELVEAVDLYRRIGQDLHDR